MANLRLTDLIRHFCSIHRCVKVLPCHCLVSAGLLTDETDHDFNRMWMGNYGIIVKERENWLDHINENAGGDVQVTASMAID